MNDLEQSLPYVRKRLEPYLLSIDEYITSDNQAGYYRIYKRPKRRSGYRYIYSCTDADIRGAHKLLYEMLRPFQTKLQPVVHGFIKGRSTYTNALPHVQKKYILHVDIKDFFDSIHISQVIVALTSLGLQPEVANFLAKLMTIDDVMRQGMHTGPDISNHCLSVVDKNISEYAAANNFTYTRYGDDLSISGDSAPDKNVIKRIIKNGGYVVNETKVKLQKRGSNQYVTGLSVFDKVPHIPRKMKKRLRLAMYYIEKYGFKSHVERTGALLVLNDFSSKEDYEYYLESLYPGAANFIVGHVGYLNSVEKDRASLMWEVLNKQNIRDYQ